MRIGIAQAASWTQGLAREMTGFLVAMLPPGRRPYLLAGLLFTAASVAMYLGNAALLRYGLSWALISLLVIAAAAQLWGVRPAVLVLSLSALYGSAVIPVLHPLPLFPPVLSWHVILMRTLLFVACGAATVWLTSQSRLMRTKAETRRGVVTALRSTLLPATLADVPGYEISSVYKPFHQEEEVGGDFYDFYPIRAGHYGLLIGDVMGKGKEAAASTALLRYSVRAFTSMGAQPAQVMRQLNRLIETQELQFETASLFLGFLDTRTGELCYANAGHEPPLLRRAEGREEALDSTGPILGIGPGLTYDEKTVMLGHKDALFLMTDGVTEARNKNGEFLGCEGVWRLLHMALEAPSTHKALDMLDKNLTVYTGSNECDDIAMLLLRRTSPSQDAPLIVCANSAAPETTEHITHTAFTLA